MLADVRIKYLWLISQLAVTVPMDGDDWSAWIIKGRPRARPLAADNPCPNCGRLVVCERCESSWGPNMRGR
jgi:hypothetical protein